MGRHICLKEWVNGNEISVSIDDNLCNKYRGEVVIFHDNTGQGLDGINNITDLGGSRCPTHTAELILKAKEIAKKNKGSIEPFEAKILTNNEGLRD